MDRRGFSDFLFILLLVGACVAGVVLINKSEEQHRLERAKYAQEHKVSITIDVVDKNQEMIGPNTCRFVVTDRARGDLFCSDPLYRQIVPGNKYVVEILPPRQLLNIVDRVN